MIAAVAALGLCAQAAWALPQGLSANWNATTTSDPTNAGPYASDFSPSEWASVEIPVTVEQTTVLTLSSTTITTAVEVDATPIIKPVVGHVELSSACPAYNDTAYTSPADNLYRIECFRDHYGGDIGMRYVNSLDACIAACDTFPSCILAVWVPSTPGPCYLKGAVNTANEDIEVWGAVRYPLPGVDYGVSTTAAAATTTSIAVGGAASTPGGFAVSSDSYSASISLSTAEAVTSSIAVWGAAYATGGSASSGGYSYPSVGSSPAAATALSTIGDAASASGAFAIPSGVSSISVDSATAAGASPYATQTFTMLPGGISTVSVGSAPAATASYPTQSVIMPSSVQGLDIASMLADNMSATQSVTMPTASLTPFNASFETATAPRQ
ncbi:hypothetical protein H2199_003457 [Coniosporium tulheliwenetii]|uniref:Uncharacterized protein n=1 Tax=Coniosporium tulheliwenetii TaxID=3383036 RepID=A0ACC2ZAI3_9PEZI|nr:hypothetical protein H2199_003457 [Cladosporium sp. JES 115]